MLEEIGLPYETVWLEYGTTMKSSEYLAVNPMGKVPALTHATRPVTMSSSAPVCVLAWLTDMVIDTSGFRDAVASRGLKAPSAKPTQMDTITRIVMQ